MIQAFNIHTEAFAGPLETLLNLIEDRKMSISDISLAEVTDAYLAHVEKLPELPLDETAQFVLVASTLLLIKSRTLLPTLELSSDERDSVEELERRLARYALIRKAARYLRKEWGVAPLFLAKRAPARAAVFSPGKVSTLQIAGAVRALISTLPKVSELARAAVAPILALEDVVVQLKKRLASAFKAHFSELIHARERDEVIVYFLAMLELVRVGSASVSQERLFADITIEGENVATPRFGT